MQIDNKLNKRRKREYRDVSIRSFKQYRSVQLSTRSLAEVVPAFLLPGPRNFKFGVIFILNNFLRSLPFELIATLDA